ncbi:MAG: hypothetical protein ACKVOB_12670 [Sphingomonas sp.]
MGTFFGTGMTLLIQLYGRRKVRLATKTLTAPANGVEILARENERQVGQISRLEERIATLERIATDPAERAAREIEALR